MKWRLQSFMLVARGMKRGSTYEREGPSDVEQGAAGLSELLAESSRWTLAGA